MSIWQRNMGLVQRTTPSSVTQSWASNGKGEHNIRIYKAKHFVRLWSRLWRQGRPGRARDCKNPGTIHPHFIIKAKSLKMLQNQIIQPHFYNNNTTQRQAWSLWTVPEIFVGPTNLCCCKTPWWRHLGAETCSSWHLIWSVFCDLFCFILISAYCWILNISNPITGLDRPWGFQEVEALRFQDNRHMKVVRLFKNQNTHSLFNKFYPKFVPFMK